MVHKFCESHLAELYEAIKEGRIGDIERIEHELSKSEECVACAYALKAEGEAKTALLTYLKSEGFRVEMPQGYGSLFYIWIWGLVILTAGALFVLLLILLKR